MEERRSRFSMKRIVLILCVGALVGLMAHYALAYFAKDPDSEPVTHFDVGGTASAAFMMDSWRSQYRKQNQKFNIHYKSTGSTQGVNDTIDKKFLIGFTHAPLTPAQTEKAVAAGGEAVQIPVVICAVAPVYNLKEMKGKQPIQFTAENLAEIYLGKITMWDDERLQKNNKEKLPHMPIVAVSREDSSGTTSIFADYLFEASKTFDEGLRKDWQEKIGPPKSEIKWPVGVGKPRNLGVATYVSQTEGAIGYVDLLNVHPNHLDYGAVQNRDKTAFIHADPDNMEAAAQEAAVRIADDLNFKVTYLPGANSYPICGPIYAICFKNQPSEDYQFVVDFLKWITHDGQKYAKSRTYAPLPAELVGRIDEKINSITRRP